MVGDTKMQESIIGTLRGTIKDSVSILEARVISTKPLQLQSVMDSALIIQESNMYPIDEQFQDIEKEAIVEYKSEVTGQPASQNVKITINNLSKEKLEILDELLFRFEAIQVAEGKKYVLLNAPKEKLDEIIEVLPGMKSPTITPLANDEWVSVQSVIAEKHFWEIIGKLKSLGAEGILVLPIEKMIV